MDHTVTLSNGQNLLVREKRNAIELIYVETGRFGDEWFICEINHSGVLCTNCSNGANSNLIDGLRGETCGDLILKDDWSFAESSERPWSKVDPESTSGRSIMQLYARYKPTLQMLNEEGGGDDPTYPIFSQFVEYIENAFDAQCLRSQP